MVREEGTLTQTERKVKKGGNFVFNRDAVFTVQFCVKWCQFQAINNYRLGHACKRLHVLLCPSLETQYDEINLVHMG